MKFSCALAFDELLAFMTWTTATAAKVSKIALNVMKNIHVIKITFRSKIKLSLLIIKSITSVLSHFKFKRSFEFLNSLSNRHLDVELPCLSWLLKFRERDQQGYATWLYSVAFFVWWELEWPILVFFFSPRLDFDVSTLKREKLKDESL